MNLLVCFKIVPDFDKVLPSDWEDFSLRTNLFYTKKTYNVFDESALELGLSLCESSNRRAPGSATCTAVTVAQELSPAVKKHLYAVGFDRVVKIESIQTEFAPRRMAGLLREFITEGRFDLVLTGVQSGYADTGLVPPLLASMLGRPFVSHAETLCFYDGQLCVVHQGDFGRLRTTLELPAVVSVGNSPAALRAATLRAQLMAGKREVETVFPAEDFFWFKEPVFFTEKAEKDCRFFEEKDAAERLFAHLWGGGSE
ncbi:MAG: hypothetical protein LBS36_02585 [Oscillospiraceae bacterium]|jgi:electron transfer flavoprotein beta subunit|nr:hypothetical protein [Oscillospiraceae bacterium]